MSATVSTLTERRSAPLLRSTVTAAVTGAAVTTAAAAALHGAGVDFAIDHQVIPLAGFAQMTALGAVLGGVILAVVNRRSADPRGRFLQVTAVLTALSCIPSVALPPDAATKLALVALHVLAAAIIVPQLGRHANAS